MISSVYNYYLANYRGREVSKYDTHKRSELKDVYSRMLKINRRSPLYKFGNQEEVQKYAIDIKETARMFKNVASSLTETDGSLAAFSRKKAGSSNENLVSVEYLDTEKNKDEKGFEIQVRSLAEPQMNESTYMNPDEDFHKKGSYSFDLGVGKYVYEFSFDVSEGKKNGDVQNQIARLINRSDIGLRAEIAENEEGKTAIRILSEQTGAGDINKQGKHFYIEDNDKSEAGNIVAFMGLNETKVMPGDAVFDIDGIEHKASSNHFTIAGSYQVELKGVDDEKVKIELKPDFDAMMENVSELVGAYNEMVDVASDYVNDEPDSDRLLTEIKRMANYHKNELDSAGFMVQEDGHIKIDDALLVQSAQEGTIEDGLAKLNNLKKDLVRKADTMSVDPMNYVSKKLIAYPNPVRNYTSPYVSSIYSGMMFNGYV